MTHLFVFLALIPTRHAVLNTWDTYSTRYSMQLQTDHTPFKKINKSKFSARLKHRSVSNTSCWSTGEDFGCTVIYFSHADPEQACHQFDRCVCVSASHEALPLPDERWYKPAQHTRMHTQSPPNSMEDIRCCETNVCLFFLFFLFLCTCLNSL